MGMDKHNRDHMINFIIKLVANTALVVLGTMLFADANFMEALLTGIVLSVVAYVLGDMGVLPRTNNITATISDIVLGGLVLWGAAEMFGWELSFTELAVIAVLLGVAEYIFHIRRAADDRRPQRGPFRPVLIGSG